VRHLAQALSADERERAARYRHERDRRRFAVGRAVLRQILSRYLAVEPGQVQLAYGKQGKPYLAGRHGGRLWFNLAHSNGLALYVVARVAEIGIDLEYVRAIPEAEEIGARFFSPGEASVLCGLPGSQKQEAFYACWTRKEAYIKATGNGLTQDLQGFDVSLAPGEPARLLRVVANAHEASRWSMLALEPAPGYVAALAVRHHGWQLTFLDFF
jgi:4'-phosphopantetheinyl transferase